ncbi:unnamed protein product [Spirodela intermedia]|uniref:Uncharacterized protein n=2 Tax=Spirodela intermedia TaxID=51605 RepID=A0A7I8LHE1_SPIIN|nr:unnamed protein product [Spirodela intermedia]CAA6672111.1 unnamed protein product [Spirodela intermedia]CAA7409262.1 unnamed protein product [Spirodela intermedia]
MTRAQLNPVMAQEEPPSVIEETKSLQVTPRRLPFVEAMINDIMTKALVDSGATHNFLFEKKASRLRLKFVQTSNRIKAINSETQMGIWEDKLNFLILQMDDFDVILGVDFTKKVKAKVGIFLHYNGLIICRGDQSCFM